MVLAKLGANVGDALDSFENVPSREQAFWRLDSCGTRNPLNHRQARRTNDKWNRNERPRWRMPFDDCPKSLHGAIDFPLDGKGRQSLEYGEYGWRLRPD
jgi:hypothetical protein